MSQKIDQKDTIMSEEIYNRSRTEKRSEKRKEASLDLYQHVEVEVWSVQLVACSWTKSK